MRPLILFLCLSAMGIMLTFAVQYLYFTDALMYQTFGGQMALERINTMFTQTKKWQWVGYITIPLIVLLRVSYTAVLLYTGLLFADMTTKFGRLITMALWADFVFVLSGVTKLVILIFFREVTTLHDLQFQPLSVLELLGSTPIDTIFIYPLGLVNLFELSYFLVLAWLLRDLLREERPEMPVHLGKSLGLVSLSYGSGLILWIIMVMFISLNLT